MRFYDFIKENVVGLPVGQDMSTVKHLRNFFSYYDKLKNPGGSMDHSYNVEPHWSDKMHGVESDNFSAYSSLNPIEHKDLVGRVSKEIKARGGIVHKEYPAKNDIDRRHTTTLEFVDRNGLYSHAAVRSYDNNERGLGWRHEIHVTQNKSGSSSVTESVMRVGSSSNPPYNIFRIDPTGDGEYEHLDRMSTLPSAIERIERLHAEQQKTGGNAHFAVTVTPQSGGNMNAVPPYRLTQLEAIAHPKGGVVFPKTRGIGIRYPNGAFPNAKLKGQS